MFWRRTHAHDGGKTVVLYNLPLTLGITEAGERDYRSSVPPHCGWRGWGVGERGLTGTTKCAEYKISADAESVHTLIGVGDDDDLISIVVHT